MKRDEDIKRLNRMTKEDLRVYAGQLGYESSGLHFAAKEELISMCLYVLSERDDIEAGR